MEQVKESSSRKRRTRKEIAALLATFKSSGLTASQFCELHQIHRSNFYKWISRRPKQKNNPKKIRRSAFAAMQVITSESPLFAEVNGIRIYQPVAASYLKELKG